MAGLALSRPTSYREIGGEWRVQALERTGLLSPLEIMMRTQVGIWVDKHEPNLVFLRGADSGELRRDFY
jgi:hypothetical protein